MLTVWLPDLLDSASKKWFIQGGTLGSDDPNSNPSGVEKIYNVYFYFLWSSSISYGCPCLLIPWIGVFLLLLKWGAHSRDLMLWTMAGYFLPRVGFEPGSSALGVVIYIKIYGKVTVSSKGHR